MIAKAIKRFSIVDMSLPAANFWFNASNIALLIGALLVALGTYGVFKTGAIKEKYGDERTSFNESETAKAKATASKADENAEVVRKSNLLLQSDLEKERAARLRLENQLAPRRLSTDQAHALIEALKPFAGQKIDIVFPSGDNEASDYAAEFEAVFKSAGWVISNIIQGMFAVPQRGIRPLISIKDKDAPSEAAKRLSEALQSLGLAGPGNVDPQLEQGSLRLLVGSKP